MKLSDVPSLGCGYHYEDDVNGYRCGWVDPTPEVRHGTAAAARRGCCCPECSAHRARVRSARMRADRLELRQLGVQLGSRKERP